MQHHTIKIQVGTKYFGNTDKGHLAQLRAQNCFLKEVMARRQVDCTERSARYREWCL